jgi:hypothetical protein
MRTHSVPDGATYRQAGNPRRSWTQLVRETAGGVNYVVRARIHAAIITMASSASGIARLSSTMHYYPRFHVWAEGETCLLKAQ